MTTIVKKLPKFHGESVKLGLKITPHLVVFDQTVVQAKWNAQSRNRTGDLLITSETHYHCAIRAIKDLRVLLEIILHMKFESVGRGPPRFPLTDASYPPTV